MRLPDEPLLESRSSAVPPVCKAYAELFGMPDDGVADPPDELALDEDPLDEEPVDVLDVLEEPDVAEVLPGGGEGAVGVKVSLLLPKPSAEA
jgi:hypothetical protein